MKIVIVHNDVSDDDDAAARDVLAQVTAVHDALAALGHAVQTDRLGRDITAVQARLSADPPQRVFNLVESLHGLDRNLHLFPMMLDGMGLPYTGATTRSLLATNHKTQAKRQMLAAGLPTPAWLGPLSIDPTDEDFPEPVVHGERGSPGRWILKSLWEHASLGMDSDSVVDCDDPQIILALLRARLDRLGGAGFAERYVAGREFNLSLLASADGPQLLPPAEILFHGFAGQEPRIVDYRAKWIEDSREYRDTPRSFRFDAADHPLLEELRRLARAAWYEFQLRGWARVDFRVDPQGQPCILEVNANPCLSPDAGFAAAVTEAGLDYTEAIRRILADTEG